MVSELLRAHARMAIPRSSSTLGSSSTSRRITSHTNFTSVMVPLGNSFNQICSVKLDGSNYIIWRSAILSLIRDYKFDGYLFGTKTCPPQFLDESGEVNPNHDDWQSHDQILLGWLYGSLANTIAGQVTDFMSLANELWLAIEELCGANNKAQIQVHRTMLQTYREGSQSMVGYHKKMKELSDCLNIAGSPIPIEDLISCTLAGLDSEYLPIVSVLQYQWTKMDKSIVYSSQF
ncbi:hypothetical protein Scep_007122 [Stephania cephalantha]|uniref:Retrotransposon Copia-like N-terminal domain-containing protein n=1 Tax=Stephania cephalantha TaxID=152367 RepID=A0AAP0KBY5_9MAGN